MMKYPTLWLAVLCTTFCFAGENDILRLGMWAWEQSPFTTDEARKQMLDFCKREGISHIDQHISIKKGVIQNAEALKELVAEAAKRNITINALRGGKSMFFEANHARTMADIRSIVEFNKSLPENSRFTGIKFDVEPYLTPEWKAGGEQRKKVIFDYLSLLMKAKVYLNENAPDLELAADVPFWWDKPIYEVEFNGESKRFVHHIQDIVDWIGIMSYRRKPVTIIRLIQSELDYSQSTGRLHSVAPSMEISKISGKEAHISFVSVPPDQFRSALSRVREMLAGNPYIRCIMLHHYGSLSTYLTKTPNEEIKVTDKSTSKFKHWTDKK